MSLAIILEILEFKRGDRLVDRSGLLTLGEQVDMASVRRLEGEICRVHYDSFCYYFSIQIS